MTPPTTDDLERWALGTSAAASLLVACVGLWFALRADSQAVLLDGLFNAVYFVMSLLSLKVAALVRRPDDERFPFGYAHFEPLMNTTKGLLILTVAVMALIGAVGALLEGGRTIVAGAAMGYGIFASAVGIATAALMWRWSRRSESPLVAADVKNWWINGLLSAVVALAFGMIFLLQGSRFEWFVPYVDPALVTTLVLLTIAVPIRMVRSGLLEMLLAAPDRETVTRIERAIEEASADVPARTRVVRVLRVGRTLYALTHVVLAPDDDLRVADFDQARRRVQERLATEQPGLVVDLVFTADERWAILPAPTEPAG